MYLRVMYRHGGHDDGTHEFCQACALSVCQDASWPVPPALAPPDMPRARHIRPGERRNIRLSRHDVACVVWLDEPPPAHCDGHAPMEV